MSWPRRTSCRSMGYCGTSENERSNSRPAAVGLLDSAERGLEDRQALHEGEEVERVESHDCGAVDVFQAAQVGEGEDGEEDSHAGKDDDPGVSRDVAQEHNRR